MRHKCNVNFILKTYKHIYHIYRRLVTFTLREVRLQANHGDVFAMNSATHTYGLNTTNEYEMRRRVQTKIHHHIECVNASRMWILGTGMLY